MSRTVLDASAFLAYLGNEVGARKVEDAIASGACLSVVNWAEVLSILGERGQDVVSVSADLRLNGLVGGAIELIPFTFDDAELVATLRAITKRFGLSLGDRACLALALRLKLPVLTSDRSWTKLDLGISLHSIR
jgi:ribonuclease VapC